MKNFFFDTANAEYIKNAWQKLKPYFNSKEVLGITTNPNAFAKEGLDTLVSWENRTRELVETLNLIRCDSLGIVYVQLPGSSLIGREVVVFAEKIAKWSNGSKVGIKIPPFQNVLALTPVLQKILTVNVTGIADLGTALRSASYGVNYISVIPGRMEEKGIDAKEQIAFIQSSNLKNTKVITGSMRTLEGLKWVCEFGTVPTIGTKVFDLIFADGVRNFASFWDSQLGFYQGFSPPINKTMTDLSVSFFEQMDKAGVRALDDFLYQHFPL